MQDYLTWALALLAVAVVLTVFFFWRKRGIDRGRRKGTAAEPTEVRRQNPQDRPTEHPRT